MSGERLPDGWRIRLRPDLLRAGEGRVLIGGSPLRVVRLSQQALTLFTGPEGRDLTVSGMPTATLARRLLAGNLADPVLEAGPVAPDQLTVVIPTRDRAEQLDRCLSALTTVSELRVLVVDDASSEPDPVATVAARHGAEVLVLPENLGPAGARNAGLAEVDTPLVAFVDCDVIVSAVDLLSLARHFADPRMALVGPRISGESRSTRVRWWERHDITSSSLDVGRRSGRVAPGSTIGWLPSACLVGRVSDLNSSTAGGFEVAMRVAEDVDLVWRLTEADREVRYDAEVPARHEVRGTMRGWLGRKVVYGSGAAELYRRHGDRTAPAVLAPATAVAGLALLQRRWWSLPVAGAATVLVARRVRGALPEEAATWPVAARLAAQGVGWAARQESALLLRDWWPLTAALFPFSRTLRRTVVSAIVVDAAVQWHAEDAPPAPSQVLARRLSDLAYGTGVWGGALRARNLGCLVPRWVRQQV